MYHLVFIKSIFFKVNSRYVHVEHLFYFGQAGKINLSKFYAFLVGRLSERSNIFLGLFYTGLWVCLFLGFSISVLGIQDWCTSARNSKLLPVVQRAWQKYLVMSFRASDWLPWWIFWLPWSVIRCTVARTTTYFEHWWTCFWLVYFVLECRIDATKKDGSFGRLINDDHLNPNLKVTAMTVDGHKYPVFFSKRRIEVGEELTYCYGGPDESYPWRQVIAHVHADSTV